MVYEFMFDNQIAIPSKTEKDLPQRSELAQLGFSVVCHLMRTVFTHVHVTGSPTDSDS